MQKLNWEVLVILVSVTAVMAGVAVFSSDTWTRLLALYLAAALWLPVLLLPKRVGWREAWDMRRWSRRERLLNGALILIGVGLFLPHWLVR